MSHRALRWALAGMLAIVPAAGCAAGQTRQEDPVAPVAASRQSPAQVEQSLATLRRLDGLPLYEMTYVGDYDPLAGVATSTTPSPFGCSLFTAPAAGGGRLFARNFDWEPHAALLLHTAPRHGYPSVSMVDISYLDIAPGDDLSTDAAARRRLLNSPLLPFDGMNSTGLAIGLAADNAARADQDPAKPTVGGVRVIRLVLDQAATVAQAVAVLDRYSLNFSGGPPLHYLISDAHGDSAVVEFVGGKLTVEPGTGGRQVLTNIQLAGMAEPARMSDWRYRTASTDLAASAAGVDWRRALAILHHVAQPTTRWSVVYDQTTGAVHLVSGQQWAEVHQTSLPRG